MPSFTDQLNRSIFLETTPRRIVSLVPSQTELLYTLSSDPSTSPDPSSTFEVVGITKFCIHPDSWFRTIPRVGGTKNIHPELIDALQPDLIIANKEENDRQQIETLAARYPVWVSDVSSLPSALDMIRSIGALIGREEAALQLAAEIERRFTSIALNINIAPNTNIASPPGPRTAYLIWRNPWMAAGGDTFIHDMLLRCGLTNIFASHHRYPDFELATLASEGCEQVLLSSEPYPFREKHLAEISAALPNASIRLVDGELFSWYGSRLLRSPGYFRELFPPPPANH